MTFDWTQYELRRTWGRSQSGSTRVSLGLLNAIIKYDDASSSPDNVYNEIVALRLAQTIHIPVADGALVTSLKGPLYASLVVASNGLDLPHLRSAFFELCAKRYPREAAGLVAFDIWIGNFDRARNIKASLLAEHIRVFRGFDHSHCLLNVEASRLSSVKQLATCDLIVRTHPFYGLVGEAEVARWVPRIQAVSDDLIDEACDYGEQFRNVKRYLQKRLASALKKRRDGLAQIIESNKTMIFDCHDA